MKQENKQEGKQEMKKVTFATLKSLANKGLLYHKVRGQHGAYGFAFINDSDAIVATPTTVEDLARFKATKNWIQTENLVDKDADAQLSNCIYYINFYFAV